MNITVRKFIEKNREILQLVYGITLIVLIPLLIVFNTVFIINRYNQSMDATLQRQALAIGRTMSTLMAGDLPWEYFIQTKLDLLTKNNPDILELSVLQPEEGEFKIVASSKGELIGKTSDSFYFRQAWLLQANEGLATASEYLGSYGYEMEIDENERHFWLIALPMTDSEGQKSALLTVKLSSKIITETTNANRNASIYLLIGTVVIVMMFLFVAIRLWDYALLYKKSKELDQMKNDFISMASHELRTPVTGIRGHSSMILDGSLGEVSKEAKKSVELIGGAASRLASLVEDLLNVSRIEQGRIKIDLKPTNITRVIRSVTEELKIQAKEKKLQLIYDQKEENIPKTDIDVNRLKQVLINIIGNAIKYTERGTIEVIVESTDAETVRINVKDTGLGMAAKDKEHLFEKFYRIQNDHTKNITGTGLGLWITKQLVEMMHGKISVDSIENVGTQFSIEFPWSKK